MKVKTVVRTSFNSSANNSEKHGEAAGRKVKHIAKFAVQRSAKGVGFVFGVARGFVNTIRNA